MEITPFRRLMRKAFAIFGLDIGRRSKSPINSLLGLRNLSIETIIDVGANNGQFARRISRVFPQSSLYCFEPLPGQFKILESWAHEQNGRVKAFNVAIGDSEETAEIFYHTEHSPSSSLLSSTATISKYYPFTDSQIPVNVKLTTLDKSMSNFIPLMKPEILIKLDVQGYEDRVIRGGSQILSLATACLLEVNVDDLYYGQADFKELILLLDQMSFCYAGNLEQVYASDGHVIYFDAVFVKRDSKSYFKNKM